MSSKLALVLTAIALFASNESKANATELKSPAHVARGGFVEFDMTVNAPVGGELSEIWTAGPQLQLASGFQFANGFSIGGAFIFTMPGTSNNAVAFINTLGPYALTSSRILTPAGQIGMARPLSSKWRWNAVLRAGYSYAAASFEGRYGTHLTALKGGTVQAGVRFEHAIFGRSAGWLGFFAAYQGSFMSSDSVNVLQGHGVTLGVSMAYR